MFSSGDDVALLEKITIPVSRIVSENVESCDKVFQIGTMAIVIEDSDGVYSLIEVEGFEMKVNDRILKRL
tara:strand:- start:95 stop:304 length:210 start_codon:yes stop_codon:yes gene_type:complete